MQQSRSRSWLLSLITLLGILVLPVAARAQTGKVTGVVIDSSTGRPIDGAQLVLQGTGYAGITNANGRFFLLSVPPGNYTLVARRLGYGSIERPGVLVSTDVTREVNVTMSPSASTLSRTIVRAEAAPLIERGQTGSQIPITSEEIQALPVTSIEGALQLQQGFLQAPNSTDLISQTDSRRNPQSPINIRGGRSGETLMLIDGIPVQNFILGGPALSLSPEAAQQVDLVKGGFGPEYGNALSGIINIATKEGGTQLAGALTFLTGQLGSQFGSAQDDLRGYDLVEGFVSGPVPGTADKLRFMFSGRQEVQADAVLEFDDDIFRASEQTILTAYPRGRANYRDVYPGWRAFGYNNTRQAFGKLRYDVNSNAKVTVTVLDNQKQRKSFDPNFQLKFNDYLDSPAVRTSADSAAYIANLTSELRLVNGFDRLVQASIASSQRLYATRYEQRLSRGLFRITAGLFGTERQTCNYFQGVCLGLNFADANFTSDQFIGPLTGSCNSFPTCGTDPFFGGDKLDTKVFRGDVESQVTDHHNLRSGVLYQSYDFRVNQVRKLGQANTNIYTQNYSNSPYDVGLYVQDIVEYDFVTVKLGARFDYGKVPGKFFANPIDPTNGTTALTVCNAPNDPRWANGVRFPFVDANGVRRDTLLTPPTPLPTGGCANADLQVAGRIASFDDFASAKARKQFSPRIGLSFPISERSSLFFNFGRYSQNPLLNNLLTNTGIGTVREGTTTGPVLNSQGSAVGLIGNPNLQIERATTYEMGYNSEFLQSYALGVVLYNKNQSGLTGSRTGGQVVGKNGFVQLFDPGVTYGGTSTPSYTVLVNQDFQTVQGAEVQMRRRVTNFWGFDVNYSFSRARTNASDTERELERVNQGDARNLTEVPSDIDQAHNFNASLIGRVRDEPMSFPGARLLRHTAASLTVRAASGFPYTPIIDFVGSGFSQLDRNEARGPSTSQVDLKLSKGLRIANVTYDLSVQVNNLLDRKNCVQVFASTGECTTGAPDQGRRRSGNSSSNPDDFTSTYFDRAYFYGDRRAVLGRIRVSF